MSGTVLKEGNCKGYKTVTLYANPCEPTRRRVHRLVAEAFIPNPDGKPQVNHIDCNPGNNRVENLEWVTAKENVAWMIACGRDVKYTRPLKATNLETGEVLYFRSSLEAVEHGFSRPAIWRNMTGEYSHHHGYRFEFAEAAE